MNPLETSHLQLISTAQCPKLSPTAEGLLSYNIWQEKDSKVLYLALAANDGGGYFSHELIPVTHIMACLATLQASKQSFPAVRLRTAFEGKSANNASFLAAVLRHQQVLLPSVENTKQHTVAIDIANWPERLLHAHVGSQTPIKSDSNASSNQTASSSLKPAKGRQKTAQNASPVASSKPNTVAIAEDEDELEEDIIDESHSSS